MDLQIANAKSGTTVKVSDETFGAEFKQGLIHQVVTAYLAGARSGTKAQKSRSDVSGGGAKPWRQKGTGRARAGTLRSPIWEGGGKTFAARPRDYSQKVNRKMYRGAMRSILSELVRQDRLLLVEDLSLQAAKTKELVGKLRDLGLDQGLIVVENADEKIYLAARNLPGVEVLDVTEINPVSLVGAEKVLMTAAAVKRVEENLG